MVVRNVAKMHVIFMAFGSNLARAGSEHQLACRKWQEVLLLLAALANQPTRCNHAEAAFLQRFNITRQVRYAYSMISPIIYKR